MQIAYQSYFPCTNHVLIVEYIFSRTNIVECCLLTQLKTKNIIFVETIFKRLKDLLTHLTSDNHCVNNCYNMLSG